MATIALAAHVAATVPLFASDAANSLSAAMVENVTSSPAPPSFNNDPSLFLFNLFLMTAGTFLGAMMLGRQCSRIWAQRRYDHPLDPVSLYRLITLLAAGALTIRCGAEAMSLWGWNPDDPVTSARVMMAKRWLDPIALVLGFTWMAIALLGEPGIEHQLRKSPLPVDMWSRWPVLVRAGVVIILSFVAALVAVIFR
ncbi:hypothetical protein Q5H91_04190 [Sphingomonas sp. KR1UV-12]|uniref:DUF2214 family protein n=1 Tax=Sphingomonas aurea TaxID=3063994 RepID=A0ABT9EHH1_9SPHN|nr:hypothetical protein [Sphingomonas sp. KR1UV-12]MDP1026402.1 hypothetical protein [Sphingomonas sp. KR1UV-12]